MARRRCRGFARSGHEAVVKLLLEKADIESKPSNGQMPLLWAAKSRHEAVVKLLLEKGLQKVFPITSSTEALVLSPTISSAEVFSTNP